MLNNIIYIVKSSRITTFKPKNNLKKYEFASKFISKEINVGAGFAVYMLNNIIDNVKNSKITTFVPINNLKKYEFASKFVFKQ